MLTEKQAEEIKAQLLKQLENLPDEQSKILREQIKNLSPSELEEFIRKQVEISKATEGKGCLFCLISSGKQETIKIYEDEKVLAFLDINPVSNGHTLVIPKKHYKFLSEMPFALIAFIFNVVGKISEIIIKTLGASGVSIYIAQGIPDQRIDHLYINIIPRYGNDGLSFKLPKKKISKEELKKTATKIKKFLRIESEREIKKREKKEKKKINEEVKKQTKLMGKRIP